MQNASFKAQCLKIHFYFISWPEWVVVFVVGGLELDEHEIAGADRRGQEEDLHCSVVQRNETEKDR
jgi:hypothetical protein